LYCNREISSDRRVRARALITIDVELPKSVRVDLSKRNGFTMSRTVLVVDDDASVLEAIAGMLEDLGCEVISAKSGQEALDRLRRNKRISILITDMPGMDGHELAERARRLSPELKILRLSGRERRRDGYPMIRKPFSTEDLVNAMQKTTGVC
jgi:CheY-like chemotaxis protein